MSSRHEAAPQFGTEDTMKYMLLICVEAPGKAPAIDPDDDLDVEPWVEEMDGRGIRQLGSPLQPASEATTVRVRSGEVLLTDGPYAETKEQIAGFDLIEAKDLDEAIEVASKHPMARIGMVDVRALVDL